MIAAMRFGLIWFFSLILLPFTVAPVLAGAFSGWAAVVVAGDYRAHDGSPSEAFDNARRDVSADLVRIGFDPAAIEEFSVRPDRYPIAQPGPSTPHAIADALWDLSNRTSAGCFVYFSSHGSPDGVVVGDTILSPAELSDMLDNSCAKRPTVVVISACFSGVFVRALAAPNRMIVTAARPDRASFGCGTDNKYPYFDDCFLQSLPRTHDFPDLALRAKACVARLEKQTHMAPPSDPQISIGSQIAGNLPGW